ncbi:MAG: FkbM family methyltransferase [Bacteroidia bacterium]|nr:MAG: FkbM family methyltransferase [Bacteroidia bacterium]
MRHIYLIGMPDWKRYCKKCLAFAGIDLTKNMAYDRLTLRILKSKLDSKSNCIDIGCHDGEVLKQMIKLSPAGRHYAFEPIPEYYELLLGLYGNRVTVLPFALSDRNGITAFHYVRNAPAYSGLRQRKYATSDPDIQRIEVETRRLDDVIPTDTDIDFIKIDVEGAEFLVLQGAKDLIKRCKPMIIFEFGLGASDYYQTKPTDLYYFLVEESGMQISLLQDYLANKKALEPDSFLKCYHNRTEYYFIAHP